MQKKKLLYCKCFRKKELKNNFDLGNFYISDIAKKKASENCENDKNWENVENSKYLEQEKSVLALIVSKIEVNIVHPTFA